MCGNLQGFARVPRCDDAAVMEALRSRGPLAISFDASRPSFRFYSAGIYVDTEVGLQLAGTACLFSQGLDIWRGFAWSTVGQQGYLCVVLGLDGCRECMVGGWAW
jgi:hypothetical protein